MSSLQEIHDFVWNALLQSPFSSHLYTPCLRHDQKLSATEDIFPDHSSSPPPTESESQTLHEFLLDFPRIQITSDRYVATIDDFSVLSSSTIRIHGRIVDALNLARADDSQDPQRPDLHAVFAVRFLIIVNILHELGHAVRTRSSTFLTNSNLDSSNPPYYVDLGLGDDDEDRLHEAGFLAEQAMFGGIICMVFKNETNGERPPFFDLDFNQVDHFFLLCRNEQAYHLATLDIEHWLQTFEAGTTRPFDVSSLKSMNPVPKSPRFRMCAMINSTHLPRRRLSTSEEYDTDEEAGETYMQVLEDERMFPGGVVYRGKPRAKRRHCVLKKGDPELEDEDTESEEEEEDKRQRTRSISPPLMARDVPLVDCITRAKL